MDLQSQKFIIQGFQEKESKEYFESRILSILII